MIDEQIDMDEQTDEWIDRLRDEQADMLMDKQMDW